MVDIIKFHAKDESLRGSPPVQALKVYKSYHDEETKRKIQSGRWYRTTEHFAYYYSDHRRLFVPMGTEFDLASIPPIATFLTGLGPGNGKVITAALVHDVYYRSNKTGMTYEDAAGDTQFWIEELRDNDTWVGVKYYPTKQEADKLFRDIAVKHGANKYQAWMIYHGVKWFGGIFW